MEFNITACVVVFVLVCLDYISGTLAAIKNKEFKSSRMREGIWHKFSIFIILGVAWVVNIYWEVIGFPRDFASILPIAHSAIAFMETASIAENVAKINPELKRLAFWKMFENKEEEKDKGNKK